MARKGIKSIVALLIAGVSLASCDFNFFGKKDEPEKVETNKEYVNISVVNGSGEGSYEKGAIVTLVASDQNGYTFIGWKLNGQIVSTSSVYKFNATEDGTYVATFIKNQEIQPVSITVVGGTGSGSYNPGTLVTISTTEQEGKIFSGWSLNGDIVSTSLSYSFTVSEAATYIAVFKTEGSNEYEKVVTKKSNQDFKILNLTDVQLHDGEDYSITEHVINTLVEREHPDMITFLGDLLNDHATYKSIVNAQRFIAQVDSYNIPWAPIFGNHDYEDYQTGYTSAKTTTSTQLASWYTSAQNCLFTYGPSTLPGKGNYFVTVNDETTGLPVQTLIFFDSRLSGLSDAHNEFYRDIIEYSREKNNGTVVPSIFFSHIALSQYGDEYAKAKECDYTNIVGSINRDPCDLASGTTLLFPSMKELGSTDLVICGHDHENAYYTVNDGITLAYSMKSSQGDNFTNFSEIGGSVVTISEEGKMFAYSKVLDIEMNMSGTNSSKGDFTIHPDTLPNWRFSGAKLCFDIEIPVDGSLKFNLEGTNKFRPNQDEKTRYGAWNRLTVNVDIVGGTNPTADFGTLTKISGNKYSYELDLTRIDLNTSGGEEAYGCETARLIYFNNIIGSFKVSNFRYDFEEITETNQLDLANASVGTVGDLFTNNGLPVRPVPSVSLGGSTLVFADDFYIDYQNNINVGTAKGTILPSGKGAHKYKGSKEFTFNLIVNPDSDTMPGHEKAILVEENMALEKNNFIGELGLKDWYNGDKSLQFDVKPLVYGKVHEGETARFALFGHNENLPAAQQQGSSWDRFTTYYHIDFEKKSIHVTNSNSPSDVICEFVDISDGWYRVIMPLNKFQLNDGAQGNDKETLKLIYIEYVKRSFKIANFKVLGVEEEENPTKSTEFKMTDDDFVIANFADVHITEQSFLSDTGTVGKTIKYAIQNSNPDIMLFSGDVAGNITQLGYLLDYLDQFEIPYFFVQGNHDHDFLNYSSMEQRIAQSEYGYIEKGPDSLNSQGNYTIKIKNAQDELVHGLVMMDTGNKYTVSNDSLVEYVTNPVSGVPYGTYNNKKTYCDPGWNGLRGNQITWYENMVEELGCDTSLICHIPPLEFTKAYEQYRDAVNKQDTAAIAACAPVGQCNMGEPCCGSMEQLGLFASVLAKGSTKNIICGHDHLNDFSLLYQGVRLTYALKTGEGAYWKNDGTRCGYTELTINSQGKTSLDQIYFNPLV